MAADPEMWNAFYDHLRSMIAELRKERAPYKDGSVRVGMRVHGGDWVDVTDPKIAQIEREIASLENTLTKHGQHA